jgi:hypothetical protein
VVTIARGDTSSESGAKAFPALAEGLRKRSR